MPISLNSTLTGYPAVWLSPEDRRTLKQFSSVERTGYLTVTELIRDFLADAGPSGENAFRIANVTIVETHLANAYNFSTNVHMYTQGDIQFPPIQRIRKIVNPGAGYSVGDELYYNVNGARSNVFVKVTAVDTDGNRGVTGFEVWNSGDYNADPVGASKRFEFRKRKNPYAPYVLQKDISYEKTKNISPAPIFQFMGRHTGNGYVGSQAGPTKVPKSTVAFYNFSGSGPATGLTNWTSQFGTDGGGGPADDYSISQFTSVSSANWASTLTVTQDQTRWPVDGLWANIKADDNNEIFVGSELILAFAANTQSYIDAGTVITSIDEIEVVSGTLGVPVPVSSGPTPVNYYETTSRYIWFTTNKTVQVDKGDQFYVKGNGFVFSDNTTSENTAEFYKVIVESTARVDPFAADRQPVTASIAAISGSSVRLTNLSHGVTDWFPRLFEGMAVSHGSIATNGATIANIANITIGAGNTGTANITTDVNLSVTLVNQTVTFSFDTTQAWRMAFEANGKQTMNVYAATSVQLRDNGNIARVTDYTGAVTDLSGLVGNVWSIPVLSNVSTERARNLSFTITSGASGSGYANLNVTALGTPNQPPIMPGYMVENTHPTVGTMLINTFILKQVTPLTTGESLGGVGRYQISNLYSAGTTISVTGGNIAKVIDRRIDPTDITQGFLNRSIRVAQHPQSYPLSYFANFTDRGIFLGVWEGTWSIMQKTRARQISEKDAWFNWLLLQRPVNRKTGRTRTSGQSPVFCINSVGYKYWKFVVRERDVMHPTQGDSSTKAFYYDDLNDKVVELATPYRVPADAHTEDSHAVLNTTHQIALTEDSKYLVSFLYNLTTPRFRYSDELDMIGQTAGDVSMASSDVKITAYGEATQRVYKSLSANLPYNAGLRICVLKDIYTA